MVSLGRAIRRLRGFHLRAVYGRQRAIHSQQRRAYVGEYKAVGPSLGVSVVSGKSRFCPAFTQTVEDGPCAPVTRLHGRSL